MSVECPYCGEDQEICHDDGYGYDEEGKYEQECSDCEKTFSFDTWIQFHHEAYKAPCLNGGLHTLEVSRRWRPWNKWRDKVACRHCDHEADLYKTGRETNG